MGCGASHSKSFTVKYCTLIPISNKNDSYKIELIAEEEINKSDGAKFLNQCGKKDDKKITNYLERESFKLNTIFYYYLREMPVIKNFEQSINYQPFSLPNLFLIILLSTDSVKNIPNQIIEKQTKDLSYKKFIGMELNLSEMKKKIDEANNPNITKDSLCLSEETEYEEDETIKENDNEIIICEELNKELYDNIVYRFENINNKNDNEMRPKGNKNNGINTLKIFSTKFDNISLFDKLMKYLEDKNLKKFYFYENKINSDFEGWDAIYEFFENNYNLRYIDLHCSNLYDYHLNGIFRALTDKRIRFLNLSENFITLEGVKLIANFLKNNKTIKRLNLSRNSQREFNFEGVRYILEALTNNQNIELIDFSYMNLTGCGESIGKFLSNNKSIEKIYLKCVQLNAIDFRNIFNQIKKNKTIKEIDISMNDMGGDKSIEYIADGIKENKSLNSIKMEQININNDNYQVIFDAIEKNKNITSYNVNHNSKINPKIMLNFFIKQMHVKNLEYEPFDKINPDDKNKELTLEEKKLFEKFKTERPDMKLYYK